MGEVADASFSLTQVVRRVGQTLERMRHAQTTGSLRHRGPYGDWITVGLGAGPSFQNGWLNQEAGFAKLQFLRDHNGFVHFRGAIAKSGFHSVTQIICTVPVGYRPDNTFLWEIFVIHNDQLSNNDRLRLRIYTDGRVELQGGINNPQYVMFDGITYRAVVPAIV